MFTGIIAAVGSIRAVRATEAGLELDVSAPWPDLIEGESVAVDGVCLTAKAVGPGWFGVNVVDTTLDRTRFGEYGEGQAVNLERAVRAGDRLGGHLVQGHVDGIGTVRSVTDRVDAQIVDLEVPASVVAVSVPLGSVTVDGVSLTVIDLIAPAAIRLSLIPYTLQQTTLGRLAPGARVHVEADVLGKYVAGLLAARSVGQVSSQSG
jgi:riboflavin synthase